jgi:hypothetical protein
MLSKIHILKNNRFGKIFYCENKFDNNKKIDDHNYHQVMFNINNLDNNSSIPKKNDFNKIDQNENFFPFMIQ